MAKKDAEMENMKLQMAEMVKAMKNVQHPPQSNSFASAADFALTLDTATRGRGRGRGQNPTRGGGQVGGRGRGRGSNVKPSAKDFLISSQSTRSSQSKKRSGMSPDIGKSGRGSESDEDEDADQPDPRQSEQWKIQRKRVFRKTVKVRLRLKSFLKPQEEIQRNPSFNKKREPRVKML